MDVRYGFNATLTAKPGMGQRLADLLLTGRLTRVLDRAREECA